MNTYYKNIAAQIRKDIVMMHAKANSSHIGSAFSCVDLLVALYFDVIKTHSKNKKRVDEDKFILSKGHAVSALYATLAQKGVFSKNLLKRYCINGTRLPGHATRNAVKGLDVSTGSLGHGLSVGAGMALAAKHDKLKKRIFVLISDGECNEGSIWEAAMFAGHHKLDNLVVIIDYNKLQAFGRVSDVLDIEPLADKWKAFGWQVKEVDGHNIKSLTKCFNAVPFKKGRPSVVISHTIKGKGVSFMQDRLEWHYKSPNSDQLALAMKELGIK